MDYSYLKDNYDGLISDIRQICAENNRNFNELVLVAVSKTFPPEQISEVHKLGQRVFGENKVQELREKYDVLKGENIEWHLVGHLQTNKVKYIADFVGLIHSVDSVKLAGVVNEQAEKHNRVIDVLVQVNTSGEDQKSGVEPEEAEELCREISLLKNVRLRGLMTIGMFTDDENVIRENFRTLKKLFNALKEKYDNFDYLSMGMTSDYRIAIEEGANMLRIGSAIFGYRNYLKT